ncbi:MAG: MotA/TolQ/ExbB proton channel family protein [Deltaproteobacteria bacterium]|nr:MAG: MotA/TolQ/ExbB proton channel family protein [Deltaproteobacteria bacterium]
MSLTERFLQFSLLGAEWVMWLLVALSVFSVYVMIERALALGAARRSDLAVRPKVLEALERGDLDGAKAAVKDAEGPAGRLLAEMLRHGRHDRDALEAFLDAARPAEKLRLERNLSYLGTVGANAPFIGLFGTVLGIIKAFHDLAEAGIKPGGDSTAVVMAGISEALVATAIGLLVAIPAVVAYNYFQRRVKNLMAGAEALAGAAVGLLPEDAS